MFGVPYGDTGESFSPHWCSGALKCSGKEVGGECSFGDRFTESEYLQTIFQWQNLCFIVLCYVTYAVAAKAHHIPYWGHKPKEGARPEESAAPPPASAQNHMTVSQAVATSNHALAVSAAGFLVGITFILLASITDTDQGEKISRATYGIRDESWSDWSMSEWNLVQGKNVAFALAWTAIGMVYLVIAHFANDTLTRSIDEPAEIWHERNLAVAIMEAASFVSAGQVVAASISGRNSTSFSEDLLLSAIFFVLGQVLYAACFVAFKYVAAARDFALEEELLQGNVAAGVSVGMFQVSFSYILGSAIYINSSLATVLASFASGFAILSAMRLFGDHVILPTRALNAEIVEDHNWGAALVIGAVELSTAMTIQGWLGWTCDPSSEPIWDQLKSTTYIENAFNFRMLIFLVSVPPFMLVAKYLFWLPMTMATNRQPLNSTDETAPEEEEGVAMPQFGVSSTAVHVTTAGSGTGSGGNPCVVDCGAPLPPPPAPPGGPSLPIATPTEEKALAQDNGQRYYDIDYQLVMLDNKAVAVAFSGHIIALGFIWTGAAEQPGAEALAYYSDYSYGDQTKDALIALTFILIGQLLLVLSHLIIDRLVFHQISNAFILLGTAREGNSDSCIGVVEAGGAIGSAVVIWGTQYGWQKVSTTEEYAEQIGIMLLFFALGQVILVLFMKLSMAMMHCGDAGDPQEHVLHGNNAIAIRLASDIIAISVCIGAPLRLSDSVFTVLLYSGLGGFSIFLSHYILRAMFMPRGEVLNDVVMRGRYFKTAWGTAALEGVCVIGMAKLLTTFLRDCGCYSQFASA